MYQNNRDNEIIIFHNNDVTDGQGHNTNMFCRALEVIHMNHPIMSRSIPVTSK